MARPEPPNVRLDAAKAVPGPAAVTDPNARVTRTGKQKTRLDKSYRKFLLGGLISQDRSEFDINLT